MKKIDISPWAGQLVSLGFTNSSDATHAIDSIQFLAPEELEPPRLQVTRSRDKVVISWNGPGRLLASPTIGGVFSPVPRQSNPYANNPYVVAPAGTMFYKVEQ